MNEIKNSIEEIFDWLREEIKGLRNAEADYYYANSNDVIDREDTLDLITEAEAKWKERKAELRANVIDEFSEKLHELCGVEIGDYQYPDLLDERRIDEIASQMKGEKE